MAHSIWHAIDVRTEPTPMTSRMIWPLEEWSGSALFSQSRMVERMGALCDEADRIEAIHYKLVRRARTGQQAAGSLR